MGALTALATITPGLEDALVDELRDLGLEVTAITGGATFSGTLDTIVMVNLYSRLAARVTLRLGQVRCESLSSLANGTRALPWKRYLHPRQPLKIRVTTHSVKLPGQRAINQKITHAIQDALRGPRRVSGRPPHTTAQVVARLERSRATLSIDSSGELLHRRGWRAATAKAPLRENLAAAVLMVAGWTPGEALVDPMCGAGTFAIEAATITAGLAPGARRSFAFESWPILDAKAWQRARAEARRPSPLVGAGIWASDRDAGAVKATQANAKRAGVRLEITQQAFADLTPPAPSGLVVLNPPYGTRIAAGSVYSHIRDVLTSQWRGWRAVVLVPERTPTHALGDATDLTSFSNGGIRVKLVAVAPS